MISGVPDHLGNTSYSDVGGLATAQEMCRQDLRGQLLRRLNSLFISVLRHAMRKNACATGIFQEKVRKAFSGEISAMAAPRMSSKISLGPEAVVAETGCADPRNAATRALEASANWTYRRRAMIVSR